jgi:transcription termination factor NusB
MMATAPFNTNLTVQPMQVQSPMTGLSDMLNLARGMQSYQQAAEMNPLQVQQLKQQVQQAERLNPLQVQQAAAQAEQARFQLDMDQNAKLYQLFGAYANDPDINSGNRAKVSEKLLEIKNEAASLFADVPDAERKVNSVFDRLITKGVKTPEAIPQAFKNAIQFGVGATGQQALQTPQLTTSGGQPALFRPGPGAVEPVQVAPQGAPQMGAPGAAPQAVTPTQMALPYRVRQPGDITPLSQGEESDRAKNQAYRQSLTTRQTDLSTARRNLDEVIKEATKLDPESFWSKGLAGDINRKLSTMLGDTTYKQLSKDLANVQIANIQAVGGSMDTVAGQQLARIANGDETYPPSVLINIARRTYADLTNLDMQAKGASQFAQKYGDNNLNYFKQKWSENADSKVFEAISIFKSVKNPQERQKAIDALLGAPPERKMFKSDDEYNAMMNRYKQMRNEFGDKYRNIQKLSETGEL